MFAVNNTYTITKPVADNGSLAKYTKILDFVKANPTKEFDRKSLLIESGYWDAKQVEKFGDLDLFELRGRNCCTTRALRCVGAIEYNSRTKKWHIGNNINNIVY